MKHEHFLAAGEFARIAGTTKHTLFHYDSIGLFSPSYRGENGYRYYSIEQLETFDVIDTLRELDMPLSEIKDYLENRSPEAFMNLLSHEEELLNQKICRLKKTKKWIQEKKLQMKEFSQKEPDKIEILQLPQQYYISTTCALSEDTAVALKISDLYDCCEKYGYKSSYNVGYLQERETLKKGIYNDYHTVYILFDFPPKKLPYRVKPAGPYLCIYHKGHWNTLGISYEKLFQYAASRNLMLDSSFYEDYILDALTAKETSDYVTRISVGISNEN